VFEEYPQHVSFGKVLRGVSHEKQFALRQFPGQPPIEIRDVEFDERLVAVSPAPSNVEPGVIDVVVKLASNVPYGQINSEIKLTTNDSIAPTKKIGINGYVMRPVEVDPPEVLLGVIRSGEALSAKIEVSSPYGRPLTLLDVENSRPEFLTWKVEPDSTDSLKRISLATTADPLAGQAAGTVKTELLFHVTSEDKEYRQRVEVYALKE
jgi:hypothetical protein